VVTVDGDESPGLATRYGVRGFPTLILFSGGKEVARRIGLCSKPHLLGMLQPHEAAAAPPSPAPRA
jgi:thioredoxin-like negative regulator of GroEL